MGITVLTNVPALQAERRLGAANQDVAATASRLASGMRIERASDDAAGLAIADRLRAEQRVAHAAVRNINEGLSLLNIADDALAEIGNILNRMADLALSAANGIQTAQTRSPLQNEFVKLSSEITRIARMTKFNDILLLSPTAGSRSPLLMQVGLSGEDQSQIGYAGAVGTLESLGLGDSMERLKYALNAPTEEDAMNVALQTKEAIDSISKPKNNEERSRIAAATSRLEAALANVINTRDITKAAESEIRDADVAMDAARLVRSKILRDASSAVLAQANQQPKIALMLLK